MSGRARDPASGLPREAAYGRVGLVGAAAAVGVAAVGGRGMLADRRRGRPWQPDGLADAEAGTAGAGEWFPVSGLR